MSGAYVVSTIAYFAVCDECDWEQGPMWGQIQALAKQSAPDEIMHGKA